MEPPVAEKKKGEKERRSSQKKKKEKEKKSGSTTKDVGSRVKKEKERDISHPPAVKTIIDRLVTLPASDDHQVSEATVSSLKALSVEERSAFIKALQSTDVARALSATILSPGIGQGGAVLGAVLWECFCGGDEELRTAASSLIPALLLAWLSRTAQGAPAAPLETLMQALYITLQRERKGEPLMFYTPQITEASVYHTPPPTSHRTTLTADALARHDRVRGKAVQIDEVLEPLVDGSVEARNKMARAALRVFSDRISLLPAPLLEIFCLVAHRIVSCGYAFDADPPPRSAADLLDLRAALSAPAAAASLADAALTRKRLPLSAQFLSLLLHSLVYCLDTPSARPAALAAITAVQQRATLELIPQVLIATSALQSVTAPTATS